MHRNELAMGRRDDAAVLIRHFEVERQDVRAPQLPAQRIDVDDVVHVEQLFAQPEAFPVNHFDIVAVMDGNGFGMDVRDLVASRVFDVGLVMDG